MHQTPMKGNSNITKVENTILPRLKILHVISRAANKTPLSKLLNDKKGIFFLRKNLTRQELLRNWEVLLSGTSEYPSVSL